MTNPSRRHLLAASATGLATGLAGCPQFGIGLPHNQNDEPAPNGSDTNPDDETPVPTPDTSAGTFTIIRDDDRFDNRDFAFEDNPKYGGFDNHDASSSSYSTPDSRLTTVEAGTNEIAVTIDNLKVDRAIDISLEYNTASGEIATTDPQTIEPTTQRESHDLTFDVTATLPELATGFVHVLARDTHEGVTSDRLLKIHRYLAIPHDGGVYYMNHGLNHHSYWDPLDNYLVHNLPRNVQAHHKIDSGGSRTVFYAITHKNAAIGGSIQISDSQGTGNQSIPQSVNTAPSNSALSGFEHLRSDLRIVWLSHRAVYI